MIDPLRALSDQGSVQLSERPLEDGNLDCLSDFTGVEGLIELLECKNGFLAFEAALHVFPLTARDDAVSIASWNRASGWRRLYALDDVEVIFFAQDILASQFGLMKSGEVVRFNPETGEVEGHSRDMRDWAGKILGNFNYETGWELARDWQSLNDPIDENSRLLPKAPFVIGGEFEASNLFAYPTATCLDKLAQVFDAIREVEDGEKVIIRGWYPES